MCHLGIGKKRPSGERFYNYWFPIVMDSSQVGKEANGYRVN